MGREVIAVGDVARVAGEVGEWVVVDIRPEAVRVQRRSVSLMVQPGQMRFVRTAKEQREVERRRLEGVAGRVPGGKKRPGDPYVLGQAEYMRRWRSKRRQEVVKLAAGLEERLSELGLEVIRVTAGADLVCRVRSKGG
jgi:hypothetical protein